MGKPKIKTLIVDDDANIRESVRLAIQDMDYIDITIAEASDVDSGIKLVVEFNPDIVILDLHMGAKSGFDFMDIMYKSKIPIQPKVIMLTADDNLNNVYNAGDKGIVAEYFLGKPFNVDDLQSLVFSIGLSIKP